jgi:SAM-dependent methyltransferase
MNRDLKTIDSFGEEWEKFDQSALDAKEHHLLFEKYFSIFPWHLLPQDAVGFDLGCGSGRWAKLVAPRVKKLYCIDPAEKAIKVAKKSLSNHKNVEFYLASVDDFPLSPDSMDFGYSLGVLHHIPNTLEGLKSCVEKLKPGAPFLVYLYYALDNRPWWFR